MNTPLGRAIFSDDKRYRYMLTRQCEGEGHTPIIMINPSVADAFVNDKTIGKVRGFGNRRGWGELRIVNLFAYITPDVRELRRVDDPVGPDNNDWIGYAVNGAERVIVAWGSVGKIPPNHKDRIAEVLGIIKRARVPALSIGTPALCGHPKHPLYQPYESELLPWKLPE